MASIYDKKTGKYVNDRFVYSVKQFAYSKMESLKDSGYGCQLTIENEFDVLQKTLYTISVWII